MIKFVRYVCSNHVTLKSERGWYIEVFGYTIFKRVTFTNKR